MDQIYKLPDETQDRFDPDPELSYTIPARLYHDPDVLRGRTLEDLPQELVSALAIKASLPRSAVTSPPRSPASTSSPSAAATASCAPSTMSASTAAICCWRAGGKAKNVITCPYHAWAYNYDGALQVARLCDDGQRFRQAGLLDTGGAGRDHGGLRVCQSRSEGPAGFGILSPAWKKISPGSVRRSRTSSPPARSCSTSRATGRTSATTCWNATTARRATGTSSIWST